MFPRHGTQQLKRETCMMQRRVSNVFVAVVATFLLVLAAISPASADVGVRVAPRPSSTAPGTPSDTAKTASTLRNAQRRSTGSYTGSYRDAELLVDAPRYPVDAQPRVVKSRGVAFDGPDAALDPDDLEPDDLGSLVYGETQVNPKFRLPIQARIINGVEVFPEKKYRWMLGVVAVSSSGTESFRCGATLISPRYALSASHCYFSTGTTSNLGSSTIALKVGAHDIDEPEKTVEVIQIIGNPAYDGSTFENDITVLRLAEDLDIAEYPPVRLEWDPAKYDENQAARVIGWGTMEQGSGETSQVLMQADVPVVSQETCAGPSSYPPGGTGLTVTGRYGLRWIRSRRHRRLPRRLRRSTRGRRRERRRDFAARHRELGRRVRAARQVRGVRPRQQPPRIPGPQRPRALEVQPERDGSDRSVRSPPRRASPGNFLHPARSHTLAASQRGSARRVGRETR